MRQIIGIDPGITGAIAVLRDGHYIAVEDMPIMANGKGSAKVKNRINGAALADYLRGCLGPWDTDIWIERANAMPGQGVSSVFSLGQSFGCILGVCAALEYRVNLVSPAIWKKHYGIGSDKELARAKAIELFPAAPLSRKKDQNRAEALLIAAYGHVQD